MWSIDAIERVWRVCSVNKTFYLLLLYYIIHVEISEMVACSTQTHR